MDSLDAYGAGQVAVVSRDIWVYVGGPQSESDPADRVQPAKPAGQLRWRRMGDFKEQLVAIRSRIGGCLGLKQIMGRNST